MKKLFAKLPAVLAVAVLAVAVTLNGQWPARAATPNVSVAIPGVQAVPIHLGRQYTATTADAVKFKIPYPVRVLGVSATARASGGTSPTLTVDVLDDGTSVLTSAISVTAGTVSEGSIANPSVADESVITIDLTIGGTSPTWDDITVVLTVVRT